MKLRALGLLASLWVCASPALAASVWQGPADWWIARTRSELEGASPTRGGFIAEAANAARLEASRKALLAPGLAAQPIAQRLHVAAETLDLIRLEEIRHGMSDAGLVVQACSVIRNDAPSAAASPPDRQTALALAHAALATQELGSNDCGGAEAAATWIAASRKMAASLAPASDPDGLRIELVEIQIKEAGSGIRLAALGERWAKAAGSADPEALMVQARGAEDPGILNGLVAASDAAHGPEADLTLLLRIWRARRLQDQTACEAEFDAVLAAMSRAGNTSRRAYLRVLEMRPVCNPLGPSASFRGFPDQVAFQRRLLALQLAALGPLDGDTIATFLGLHGGLYSGLRKVGSAEVEARQFLAAARAADAADIAPAAVAFTLADTARDDVALSLDYTQSGLEWLSGAPAADPDALAGRVADSAGALLKGGRAREVRAFADQALGRPIRDGAAPYLLPRLHVARAQARRALGDQPGAIADLDQALGDIARFRTVTAADGYPDGDPNETIALAMRAALTRDPANARKAAADRRLRLDDLGLLQSQGGSDLVMDAIAVNQLAGRASQAERLRGALALDLVSSSVDWRPDPRSDAPFGSPAERGFLRSEIRRRLAADPVRLTEGGACDLNGPDGNLEIDRWTSSCVFGRMAFRVLQATAENPAGRTLALAQASARADRGRERDLARQIWELRRQGEAAARLGDGQKARAVLDARLEAERAYDALPAARVEPPPPARLAEIHDALWNRRPRPDTRADLDNWGFGTPPPRPRGLLALFDTPDGYVAYMVRFNTMTGTSYVRALALDLTHQAAADLVRRTGGRLASELPAATYPSDIKPYDVSAAHDLFRAVFGPLAEDVEGLDELTLYVEGPLAEQPPHLMVAALNGAETAQGPERYRKATWLGDMVRLRIAPTLTGLDQARGAPEAAAQAFILADPVVGTNTRTADAQSFDMVFGGGAGDIDAVRGLPRLPETLAIARTLERGFAHAQVISGEAATETRLRELILGRTGPLAMAAFATHGLGRDDLARFRLEEPALVLTAPGQVDTALDDGLLTTSEIAELHLAADWVLLIACNTAAPDAEGRGGALSGLAEAFFFSGARSVLVSYWPVEVRATQALMEALAEHPDADRHDRLRDAMARLRNNPDHPDWAHPAMWAPFALIGD